jgi:hypothetical protein
VYDCLNKILLILDGYRYGGQSVPQKCVVLLRNSWIGARSLHRQGNGLMPSVRTLNEGGRGRSLPAAVPLFPACLGCGLFGLGGFCRRLTGRAALAAQSDGLGKLRTRGGVGRRNHGVIARQSPLLPVVLGRKPVVRLDVPLERFELLPVLKADYELWRHRFFHGYSGLQLRLRFFGLSRGGLAQGRMDRAYKFGKYVHSDNILRHVGRNNIRGQAGKIGFSAHD